jgi:hypothetical protein
VFHAVIPYVASDQGCAQLPAMSCGARRDGAGRRDQVDIPFAEVRRQGIVAVVMISAAVLVAALIALAVLRRMMNPAVANRARRCRR